MNEQNLFPNKDTQFRAGAEQVEIARAGGIASGIARRAKSERLRLWLERLQVEPMTKEEADEMDAALLAMTRKQLEKLVEDEAYPASVRRRARLLILRDDEKALHASEVLRDRVFGKPKQVNDIDLQQAPPIALVQIYDRLTDTNQPENP